MSAYIVEDKCINRILSSMLDNADDAWLMNRLRELIGGEGFPVFSPVNQESLTSLGKSMLYMNAEAVSQRYDEPKETAPGDTYKFEHLSTTRIQAIMSLACFLYQCSEGNVPDMALFKGLEEYRRILEHYVVESLPEYKEAEWG